jgi:hypothetical protein
MNDSGNMQDAILLDELRTYAPTSPHFMLQLGSIMARPASAADDYKHHEQCGSVEDEQENLRCDELVAEIEQRVTQLENVLTRYNSRYIRTGPLGSKLFLTSKMIYLNQPKREKVYLI